MTTDPMHPGAQMPAGASRGPGPQPVELRVNVNSRRIAELESQLSAKMGISDEAIQNFQERIAALEAETARIAAFVDLVHHGAYSRGLRPKRPVFRVIRGDRDNPSIITFDLRRSVERLGKLTGLRRVLAPVLVRAARHRSPGVGAMIAGEK